MIKLFQRLAIFAIATVAVGAVVLTSCNKEEEINSSNYNGQYETKSFGANVSTKQIAQGLAETIRVKPEIAHEIHSAISTVVNYGLDENITFYDILNTDKSVFLKPSANISNLRSAINVSTLQSLGFNANNYYGNLNIYWGYHDKWDKSKSPTICYLDANHTSAKAKGFSIVNGNIQEVEITQEYFDSAVEPIIIINYNEIDYSRYPNFKNGERTKGGVIWLKPVITPGTTVTPVDYWNDPSKIYSAKFTAFESGGTQHDYFWAGGSEFKVISSYADIASGSNQPLTAKFACFFTRSDIKDNVQKSFSNCYLVPDWRPELEKIGLAVIEEDGGGTDTIELKIKISSVEVSINVPIESLDDELCNQMIDRNVFIANLTSGNNYYSADDCKIHTDMQVTNRN